MFGVNDNLWYEFAAITETKRDVTTNKGIEEFTLNIKNNIHMNNINQLDTSYLRASRTIETLELSNNNRKEICYIYNYEGYHYRFFESKSSITDFFEYGFEPKLSFENEFYLDTYLLLKEIKA